MEMKFALPSGTIIEGKDFRYRIVKVLGQGSFGITYLVEVLNSRGEPTHIRLAMKEFFMNEINGRDGSQVTCNNENGLFSHYRKAFMEKAGSMASVHHENIARVGESFEANNTSYFLKNYIEGGSLEDLIGRKGRLSELHSLEIAALIAKALGAMHSSGNAHIDLRPGNVMMISGMVPVLIDFGITHHCDAAGKPETVTRVGLGTPGYAPLEQPSFRGNLDDGKRVDVYGLGATLFRMLSGERPPQADRILNEGFPEDVLKRSGVSAETIAVVRKSMSPSVSERYADVADFGDALADILRTRYEVEITSDIKEIAPSAGHAGEIAASDKETEAVAAEEARSADIDYEEYEDTEKKKSVPVLLYVLCALGIIVVALVIYFFMTGNTSREEAPAGAPQEAVVAVADSDSLAADSAVSAPNPESAPPVSVPAVAGKYTGAREKVNKRPLRKESIKESGNVEPASPAQEAKPSSVSSPAASPSSSSPEASATTPM